MKLIMNPYKMIAALALFLVGSTSLRAQDPFPDINIYDYYGNMSMSVKVFEDGEPLVQDVFVAVYVD